MRGSDGRFLPGKSGNANGVPRKTLTTQHLTVVTQLAAKGVREADIARAVGLSVPTWIGLKTTVPAVADALALGQRMMHDALIGKLYEKAMNGDTVALLFMLKSRFGYKEGTEPSEARPQIVINLP